MKLKDGKRYETADGRVFKLSPWIYPGCWHAGDNHSGLWNEDGSSRHGKSDSPDLIRRHYKKPQPSHKLDLKPGDVVELCGWENGLHASIGKQYDAKDIRIPSMNAKGERALYKVVSRA